MNSCAQYLITSDTNSAALGDLSHILNFEFETICLKFESHAGSLHYIFANIETHEMYISFFYKQIHKSSVVV